MPAEIRNVGGDALRSFSKKQKKNYILKTTCIFATRTGKMYVHVAESFCTQKSKKHSLPPRLEVHNAQLRKGWLHIVEYRKQPETRKRMRLRAYDINEYSRATGPWSGNRNNNTRPSRGICFGFIVVNNKS